MKNIALTFASALVFAAIQSVAQASAPTDPQIAAIVVTANQVDIDAGKLAEKRARNHEVRTFAKQMVVDHSGVNKSATALGTQLKVTPEGNATSEALHKGGEENIEHLKSLTGAAFDRAYISNEVTYHQSVIDALDHTLIPSAQNEELKSLLIKVRPAFVAPLEHAKQIQSALK